MVSITVKKNGVILEPALKKDGWHYSSDEQRWTRPTTEKSIQRAVAFIKEFFPGVDPELPKKKENRKLTQLKLDNATEVPRESLLKAKQEQEKKKIALDISKFIDQQIAGSSVHEPEKITNKTADYGR